MDQREHLREPTVDKRHVYGGRIIRVEELTVRLPDGRLATREVVYHPGAVAVVAEPAADELLLVEQFRKAPEEVLLELPAGKLDQGESALACAQRELAEETGFRASEWVQLFEFFTSPGFSDERMTLFYARGLTAGDTSPDEDEFVRVSRRSRRDVEAALAAGRIRDAKTLIGVLWWLGAGDGRR